MSNFKDSFETFTFSSKGKMLGILMVQELEELKQIVEVIGEERHFKEFPGVVKGPTVIQDGKTFVSATLDLCNNETMDAIIKYYDGWPRVGHYADKRVADRISGMQSGNLKAHQVGWNETLKLDKVHPFTSKAVVGTRSTAPKKLFDSLDRSLGEKAMLVVYALEIKPGTPAMFYIGSKQAKINGLLNMTQWRDTTEEEGMMVFNTFRDDLMRIGREFMYS